MVDWGSRHAASSTAVKILAAAKIKEDFGFIYFGIIFAIYFGIKKPIRHRGRHPAVGYIPNGAQSAAQSDIGADLAKAQVALVKWRHLVIREPAKLTRSQARAMYVHVGSPPEPGVGSLSRKRYTQYVEHNRKG
jgi:hypothetical protein